MAEALRAFFSSLDREDYAIAYSGGLDSTILLSLCSKWAIPYTLGSEGSRDFTNSGANSGLLGSHPVRIEVESLDLGRYVDIIRSIDPEITKRDIGYEAVLAVLLDQIPEKNIITGQGADELFYGYRKLFDDPGMSNRQHLDKLANETLPRETALASHFGKKLVTPYLDSGIAEIIADVTRDDHFSGEYNKAILRSAGLELGLPESIITVRKTAAQYGSGILKKLKAGEYWQDLPVKGDEV